MSNRVVIIEDNETLNEVYRVNVNSFTGYRVVGAYLDAETALAAVSNDLPDLVFMDIDLPGMNGIQATKEIKKIRPACLVIMITVFENSTYVFDALRAGACGYVTKNASADKLENVLNEAINGGAPMSSKIAKMVISSFQKASRSPLTEKETAVLTQLSRGGSYKGIAQQMGVSPNTIKYHVKNIYDKLQVHDRESAIRIASDKKLI